jgi:hypothetical protein
LALARIARPMGAENTWDWPTFAVHKKAVRDAVSQAA